MRFRFVDHWYIDTNDDVFTSYQKDAHRYVHATNRPNSRLSEFFGSLNVVPTRWRVSLDTNVPNFASVELNRGIGVL